VALGAPQGPWARRGRRRGAGAALVRGAREGPAQALNFLSARLALPCYGHDFLAAPGRVGAGTGGEARLECDTILATSLCRVGAVW